MVQQNNSKYGFETNAEDIEPDVKLNGKNAIVTGGYGGIGYETARVFALRGARVFVVGRDGAKGKTAVETLKETTNNNNIEFMEMDLASLDSVRKFAERFNALNIPLNYLINNAGVMATPFGKTVDGFETQMGVNHFGHFLLSVLLVPRLIEGAPSRVISVSSSAHAFSGIRWDDMDWEKSKDKYYEFEAYGQSKTANILFAIEFTRRYKDKGVISNSLHPGSITSDLQRHITAKIMDETKQLKGFEEAVAYGITKKTTEQGAATTVFAALSPLASEGGKFYHNSQESGTSSHAADVESAKRLWDISLKAVGLN